MDFNIETRKKQLDSLDQVVFSSKSRIQSVLNYLGWTSEKVKKEDLLVSCPVNPGHRLLTKSWNKHIEKCVNNAQGYDSNEKFLSESSDDPKRTIYLDHNKKIEIIRKELAEKGSIRLAWNGLDPDPKTADRLTSTYSGDERLAFYDYVVQNTEGPSTPPEFTTFSSTREEKVDNGLSYEDLLRRERDSKRRTAKYKNVHLNRKNQTEVMREVINGQMEEYKEWLLSQQENGNTVKIDEAVIIGESTERGLSERPHSSVSRNSAHSSSSKSASRRHRDSRDRRDRTRDIRDRSTDRHHHKPKEYSRRHRSRERRNRRSPDRGFKVGRRSRERLSRDKRHVSK